MHKNFISRINYVACMCFCLALNGCIKNDNHSYYPPAAGVAFVHASPKTGMLDFIDYGSFSGNALARLSYNTTAAYPVNNVTTTPYRAFLPGTRTLGIAITGSNNYLSLKQYTLVPKKLYTIFAIDTASASSLFMVEDSSRSIDSTKAAVRFINLSPNAQSVNFFINNNPTPIVANKAFKESSNYISIEPTENTAVTIATTNAATSARRENIALKAGGIYTIWARGLITSADSTRLHVSVLRTR